MHVLECSHPLKLQATDFAPRAKGEALPTGLSAAAVPKRARPALRNAPSPATSAAVQEAPPQHSRARAAQAPQWPRPQ